MKLIRHLLSKLCRDGRRVGLLNGLLPFKKKFLDGGCESVKTYTDAKTVKQIEEKIRAVVSVAEQDSLCYCERIMTNEKGKELM
jgi:hypothetical protein